MKQCSVIGCSGQFYRLEYCSKHYQRVKAYGSTEARTAYSRHKMYGTPEHRAWRNMLSRCQPEYKQRKDYYDRGIRVCEAWKRGFLEFYNHIGPRPGKGYSVDRINNDIGYEPGNVKWSTAREQNSNTTRNRETIGVRQLPYGRWQARLLIKKQEVYNKTFDTKEEAIAARKAAEERFS